MFRQQGTKMSYVGASDNKIDIGDGSFKKPVHLPATLFNKSPYKDRQNRPNAGNTPIKKICSKGTLAYQNSNKRGIVSPIKHTRQNSNISQASPTPTGSSNCKLPNKRRSNDDFCRNHTNKQAKYFIEIDGESLPYCEKCAILLASQGFKVEKLHGAVDRSIVEKSEVEMSDTEGMDSYVRKREIEEFLTELASVVGILDMKRRELEEVLNRSQTYYNGQMGIIQAYYAKITELLASHRQAVEKAVKDDRIRAEEQARNSLAILTQAISDSNNMKQDILTSLDLIKQAEQKSFRPVMQSYKQNARKFKQSTSRITIPSVKSKYIVMSDFGALRNAILQNLHVEFKSQTSSLGSSQKSPCALANQVSNIEAGSMSSVNFSFQAKMAAQLNRDCCSGVLDPIQNPDQPQPLLESHDYTKYLSSIKHTGNTKTLFSDFNE